MKIRRIFWALLSFISLAYTEAVFHSSISDAETPIVRPYGECILVTLPEGILDASSLEDNEYYAYVETEYEWEVTGGGKGTGPYAFVTCETETSEGIVSAPGNYEITFTGEAKYYVASEYNGTTVYDGPHKVKLTASYGGTLSRKITFVSVTLKPLLNTPVVPLNVDDDNENGYEDREEFWSQDSDIIPSFRIEIIPDNLPCGTVSITTGANDKIRMWMDGTGSSKTIISNETEWTAADFQALSDKTIYVEGINCSETMNDCFIALTYRNNYCSSTSYGFLTVVYLEIIVDMNYDCEIGHSDLEYKKDGPRVMLVNDDNDNWCYPPENSPTPWDALIDRNEDISNYWDDDLLEVRITFIPSKFSAPILLEAEGNTFKYWTSMEKGSSQVTLSKSFIGGSYYESGLPYVLYVEAVATGECCLKLSIAGCDYISDEVNLSSVRAGVIPDVNRDKKIDEEDREKWVEYGPHRFWLNTDEDKNDFVTDDEDLPGARYGLWEMDGRDPNNCDSVVDGRCDLLDFFPVWLDFAELLNALPDKMDFKYYISSPNIQFVYTKLRPGNAGSFLTNPVGNCGNSLNQDAYHASVMQFPQSGELQLSSGFISEIKNGGGVILCEGKRANLSTLNFIVKNGEAIVFSRELPISLDEVDTMYRRESLRSFSAPEVRQGEPVNLPDCLLSSSPANYVHGNVKDVFFLHGFHVSEKDAYGWDSEIFRRLWQSGMRARFNGVTWKGNGGFPEAFNYHTNVNNAFKTAAALKTLINTRCNTVNAVVMAHSLGNMVVCSALKDHGLVCSNYFMLNAAVPSEAFHKSNATSASKRALRHIAWEGYENRTLSCYWHELFTDNTAGSQQQQDDRAKLTWIDRFSNMNGANISNFYSMTDEVLMLYGDNNIWPSSGADSFFYLNQYSRHSWHKQEAFKGRNYIYNFGWAGTTWCGWGFESSLMTPAEANQKTNLNLRNNPVFTHSPSEMFSPQISQDMQNEILAKGIPALSPPCGAGSLTGIANNIDMTSTARNDWGRQGSENEGLLWYHSDIKNMAFFYNYELFSKFIREGGIQ